MIRSLRRNPLYALTVVLLLALSTGACILLFSALDTLAFRPPAVLKPEQLARLGAVISPTFTSYEHEFICVALLNKRAQSITAAFSFYSVPSVLFDESRVRSVGAHVISDNYFEALGVGAAVGRLLSPSVVEQEAAVLSYAFWKEFYGADPAVIGRAIRLRGRVFTIIGVADRGFTGLDPELRADVWTRPILIAREYRKAELTPAQIFVRLGPKVTVGQAEAEIRSLYPAMVEEAVAARLELEYGSRQHVVLTPGAYGSSTIRRQATVIATRLLWGIVALLVLAAINVGGLIRARLHRREGEIRLRRHLGATTWDLVAPVFAETLLLAATAASLGCVMAVVLLPRLAEFLPQRQPMAISFEADWRLVVFTVATAIGSALIALPVPLATLLRSNRASATGQSRYSRATGGQGILFAQVALAMLLVAASVSLVRSLKALRSADLGFQASSLVVATIDPEMSGLSQNEAAFLGQEVLRRARELPGAVDASMSSRTMMRGVGLKGSFLPTGSRFTPSDRLNVSVNGISETHFRNMGMRLVVGRELRTADLTATTRPVLITESLARMFFPNQDALGRTFGEEGKDGLAKADAIVVGVVADMKYRGMWEIAPPTFFQLMPLRSIGVLYVRTVVPPEQMTRRVRDMLAQIGPGLSARSIMTMDEEIEASMWQERLISFVSELFAGIATVIVAAGCFAVVNFLLVGRTKEVGIRMALGASPMSIASLFTSYVISAASPGVLLGFMLLLVARPLLSPLLFGEGTHLAPSAAWAAFIVLTSIAAAISAPVVNASRVHPSSALRHE